jgi:PII-like signaling protein
MNPGEARLLRLYLNNNDRFQGKPLHEAVVHKARELGLAGASVFTAEVGYGTHHYIHDNLSEYTFVGAPIVVEVVDSEDSIQQLLMEFHEMVGEGLVTVSAVRIVNYAHDGP